MKIRAVFVALAVVLLPLSMASDTQHRFKVCLGIDIGDNVVLEERFSAFVKRELRNLGDVDIVRISDDWDFRVTFTMIEHTAKNNKALKSGWISIAQIIYTPVPKSAFKEYKYKSIGIPVHLPRVWVAYSHIDVLFEYTIIAVNNFDEMLASYREFRKLTNN